MGILSLTTGGHTEQTSNIARGMPGRTGNCGEYNILMCFYLFTHQAVETGKSLASRAALGFLGREWGKPQARFDFGSGS